MELYKVTFYTEGNVKTKEYFAAKSLEDVVATLKQYKSIWCVGVHRIDNLGDIKVLA